MISAVRYTNMNGIVTSETCAFFFLLLKAFSKTFIYLTKFTNLQVVNQPIQGELLIMGFYK